MTTQVESDDSRSDFSWVWWPHVMIKALRKRGDVWKRRYEETRDELNSLAKRYFAAMEEIRRLKAER